MLRSGFVALAACALGIVLSACGSDKDKPVAGDITLSVAEDGSVKISLAGDNPGRDDLTATVVTPPTNGDVVFTSGSALGFTYTPRPNLNGIDAFTYQISNGDKTSNLGRVAISIGAVNDVPAIQPTLTTDEDVPVTTVLIVDIDGDAFTSTIVTPPSHGTLTVDATNPGKFTYVPAADFNGTDSIGLSASYIAPDTTTATVSGTVAITVRPVDDPPAGVADAVHTVQGTAARFEPLANDRDIDGDALAVSITSGPSVGTATVNADGSIQYTPPAAFVGNTSLEYQVRDAGGLTARATMSIGVGLTSGVLYLSRPDSSSPNELFFNDGARSFKVSGPVPDGDSIYSFTPVKSEPIVFYRTLAGQLYRVDLRQPGVAQQVGQNPPFPNGTTGVTQDESTYWGRLLTASREDYYAVGIGNTTVDRIPSTDGGFTSGAPDVLVLNLGTPDSPELVKHFGRQSLSAERDLYVLNLRDTTQLIGITDGVVVETPALIPNF